MFPFPSAMLMQQSNSGGGGVPIVPFTGFRSSAMAATSGTSTVITLQTGATAGDMLWLFRENSAALTATAGFTNHGTFSGSFVSGLCEYKVLSGGDISTGSVTVTQTSATGCYWAVCLKGAPTTIVTNNAADFLRDGGGGATSKSITTAEGYSAGDFVMMFSSQRDSSTIAPVSNTGSVDKTLTGAPAASGYTLTTASGAASLTVGWTLHVADSNGSFSGIVIVRA